MNQVIIIINGFNENFLNAENEAIVISEKNDLKTNYNFTLLQADFKSIEELIKAEKIIKSKFSSIDEIIIVNKDIDLNMISYQYDYKYLKDNYLILTNIIYLINLLINNFSRNLNFVLSFEKESHYKVHTKIFNESIINYLIILKKDLIKSHSLNIKKLN